jgi:hypothetical protein
VTGGTPEPGEAHTGPPAPRMVERLLFGGAVVGSAVVLFAPTVPGPPLFPYADLVIHLLVFGALGLTGARVGIPAPGLLVALAAYAGSSELVQQTLLPERSGSWRDLAADLVGAGVGVLVATRWSSRAGRRARQ